jgi:orotate phosphoribosyltransferase
MVYNPANIAYFFSHPEYLEENKAMQNHSLISSLFQIGAIQFGEFKLKSGQTSSIYINLRKIISYPDMLRTVAQAMWEKTRDCKFDLVCGVPYTALPIATCLSLDHNIPMIMRRKEKKDYGTKQMIEGEFKSGERCLIIEDVITTGGSIIETAVLLANAGLQVNDLVVLIDREQGGKENLTKQYHLHTILTLSEILATLLSSSLLNANERHIVEQFLLARSA